MALMQEVKKKARENIQGSSSAFQSGVERSCKKLCAEEGEPGEEALGLV